MSLRTNPAGGTIASVALLGLGAYAAWTAWGYYQSVKSGACYAGWRGTMFNSLNPAGPTACKDPAAVAAWYASQQGGGGGGGP